MRSAGNGGALEAVICPAIVRRKEEKGKQEEAFLLPSPVYRRPRSRRVNTTPRCGVPPEGGGGPLGGTAQDRLNARLGLASRAARHRWLADLRC
jgi:hypothetical protein